MCFMLEGVVANRAWGSAEVQGGVVLGIGFRLRLDRFSVWARLDLIQLLLLLSLSMTSLVARHAIGDGRHSRQVLAMLSRAERHHPKANVILDALRTDVNAPLRLESAASRNKR
jgi:hypothetical protein